MAFAIGAQADYLSSISYVEGTSSNLTTIPCIGDPVTKMPSIKVTSDYPYYIFLNFYTDYGYGRWEKKVNGEWQTVSTGNFTEGTWRFSCIVALSNNSAYDDRYIFSENIKVVVNGTSWAKSEFSANEASSTVRVYSPGMPALRKISQVVGTSSNLTTIPDAGNSVTTKPTINITQGSPATFEHGCWQVQENGEWKSVTSGVFYGGNWRYAGTIKIPSSSTGSYCLASDVVMKINGVAWDKANTNSTDNTFEEIVYSPVITIIVDSRTKISTVEATSPDLAEIPVIGESVEKDPTITVTKGAPAYFTASSTNGKWQKKVNGEWQYANSGTFTEGTWRYATQVRIDKSVDPNNQYVLTNNVSVKVNGSTWTKGAISNSINDTYSFVAVYSPEITAKVGDLRTKISTVAGTSSDLATIPVVGESVKTKPTITVTSGSPARFSITNTNGEWQKKVNGQWQSVTSGTFTAGDSYRFTCQVRIDATTDPDNQYVLDRDVKVKVNGNEWQKGSVTVNSTSSYVQVYSPEVIPGNQQIHAVDALLDAPLSSYLWVGLPVTDIPEFEVVIGSPAYFANDVWEKKVNGQWQAVTSGTITSGTWRLHTYVMLYGTQGYTLASDLRVKVDGLEWQRGSNYTATMVDFYSPEVTAKTEARSGSLGTKGTWQFADGVLTVTYNGKMPNCDKTTTDPETAYRLKWTDFLGQIEEVVVKGQDVEIQPYFLYYESTETTDGNHPDDHIKKVTLGSGVKKIGDRAFSLYEINRVDCYSKEPPTTSLPVFWNKRLTNNTAWLHLVGDASTSYDSSDPWSRFSPRILRDLSMADDPDLRLPVRITLDKTYLEFNALEQTYRLTATIYPSNVSDKTVTWTSSDMTVATVHSSGLVRAVGSGTATITAKTMNGLLATCEVKVSIPRNGTLGPRGVWEFANGVLTVDYQGAMPEITKSTSDPDKAFRLQWEEFLGEIEEVVVTGQDVEIQPYFLYFEGDGPNGSHPDDHIRRVTLGSGVKKIGDRALSLYSMSELLCYSEEPPVLASDLSSSYKCFWKNRVQANDAWLYVLPYAGVNYGFAGGEWSYFNIMGDLYPEDDPVGINRPTPDPSLYGGENRGWYTLDGRKLDGKPAQPGLYVKDGKKVMVRK